MKMLWKVKVVSSDGEERKGWVSADNPVQAVKMAMAEGAQILDEPEEWIAGEQSQVFLQVH